MSSRHLQRGRCSFPGGVYALTTVTHGRRPIFKTPGNAEIVIASLRYLERSGVSHSFAWVVMPDHVHWLLQLRKGSLASCMLCFKSRSSRLLGQASGLTGRLWQPSYFDQAVRSEASLREHALYIAANPVRAGLANALGDYPFAWCRWPLG
ncbi:REP-associated tyrosine transposase [Stenotrophomonas tumulicola]|uniref:Transposase n=1 Tax=Stenotrophomonas tumulicola TaxID=1685415 RepID=A0A7W3FQH3_9GAMM|nr:transposase [Stenotrophomonas tumulicola]MBA8683566.1 transposase [Stenotrophomonas tumulicola]